MTTAANYTEVAQQLYLAYFGRPADPAGLTNLTAALLAGGAPTSIAGFKDAYASGGIVKTVLDSFGTSAESNALYTGTDSQFISAVYQHMLGRDPLLSGLQFWTNALRNHEMSRAEAAVQIMAAAVKPDANPADAATVAHRVTMATLFTAALDTPTEIAFYQGSAVAQEVRDLISAYSGSYDPVSLGAYISQYLDQRTQPTPMGVILTLQHGPDVATGGAGNDTINAPSDAAGGDTLEAQDSVDGALGTDTMNLATQGVVAGGAAVKNVETVNLSSNHAITSADLSGWTGLTKLNISGSGAIGGVVVAAGTDVNVSAGHGNISLSGGHNVVLSTNGGNLVVGLGTAASGSVAAFNTTAGGTTSVDTSGFATVVSTDGAVTISDTTGFIVSAGASVALADRSAHAAALASASAASAAALADTDAAGVAKLAAAAAVNTLAALAGDIAVATNVSADASTALSVQKATTAAFHAGAITAAQKIALDGAFGAALPTSQAAAAAAAQALLAPIQAAADKASAAAIAADVANDGAANGALGAANAAVSADQTAAAAAAGVVVTATSNTALATATVNGNFGAVGNAITDTSAHHDTLTAVTLNNAGATTITGQAMVNLSASDMVDDVTIVNATGGHSTALALSGIAGGLYTDDHAARLTIAADGSAQNVLRGLHAGAATAITVTGAGGLDFGTLDVAAGAVINATASSGNNAVSVAAGLSYLGGAGADTVTTGAVAQTAAVSGGAGGADKLILTSSANAAAAPAALFAGFEVLQVNSGVVANVANFTASTFSSVVVSGDAEVDGLNATEAAHVALTGGAQAIVLGVSGATTPGQLDSVTITNAGAAATLAAPSLAGVETLNLIDGKAMSIGALTSAAALIKLNASGAGDLDIATGALALNAGTVIDAHLSTGAVTVDAAASTANGLTIIGSAVGVNHLTGNTSHQNTLTGGNAGDSLRGGSAADVLTAGHGNNVITGGGGNDTITAGNGDNTINAAGTGGSTITAGNGWNVITGGTGADTIRAGTGGNLVTGGGGADKITFGSHVAGVIDGLVYGALNGSNDTGAAITANGTLAGADVITGLHGGDRISLGQPAGTLANDLAGSYAHAVTAATASAEFVRGSYTAATGLFTASASGTDTMLAWSDGNAAHGTAAIVLVGYSGATASALSAGGIVTLG